jgi:hypothetical protein
MGLIEDLVAKVPDDYFRGEIEAVVAALKQGKRFGLVFEEHIPRHPRCWTIRCGPVRESKPGENRQPVPCGASPR